MQYEEHLAWLPKLRPMLWRLLRSEADVEDALAETALALWQDTLDGKEIRHPKTYCFSIARRQAIAIIKARLPVAELPEIPFLVDLDAALDRRDALRKAKGTVKRLGPITKAVAELAFFQSLDTQEIMRRTGYTAQQVKRMRYHAIQVMAKAVRQ